MRFEKLLQDIISINACTHNDQEKWRMKRGKGMHTLKKNVFFPISPLSPFLLNGCNDLRFPL